MVAVDKAPRFQPYWAVHPRLLQGLTLSTHWYLTGTGSGDAGDIWTPAMTKATAGLPAAGFTMPPDSIIHGTRTQTPSTAGMSPSQAQALLESKGYSVSPRNVYDNSAAGTYIGASCDGFVGGSCFLNYSQGPRPAVPGSQPT